VKKHKNKWQEENEAGDKWLTYFCDHKVPWTFV